MKKRGGKAQVFSGLSKVACQVDFFLDSLTKKFYFHIFEQLTSIVQTITWTTILSMIVALKLNEKINFFKFKQHTYEII